MKYIYYYMWLINAKIAFHLIWKPLYKLRVKIRNTRFEIKNIDDKELQRRKKDLNTNGYDFPDGVTHWYAFSFLFLMFLAVFLFIPLFTIDIVGEVLLDTHLKFWIYMLSILAICWYLVYIKKSNKEWLKKKIDKKKKDFYL